MGAAATIDTLTVGNITQHRVPAVVASPGTLNENLLGQSFLRNLRQVNVENNRVTLTAD
jgi:aspartyl protease family protein